MKRNNATSVVVLYNNTPRLKFPEEKKKAHILYDIIMIICPFRAHTPRTYYYFTIAIKHRGMGTATTGPVCVGVVVAVCWRWIIIYYNIIYNI